MSGSTARSVLRPERPLLVAAIVVTALVTAWLFVPTMQGHVATMNVGSVDVTTSNTAVTDGGESLTTTLSIHNPTRRDIVFYSGLIHVYDGETQLSDGTTTPFGETTIPAKETVTLQVEIDLNPTGFPRRNVRYARSPYRSRGASAEESDEESVHVPLHAGGSN